MQMVNVDRACSAMLCVMSACLPQIVTSPMIVRMVRAVVNRLVSA